MKPGKIARIVRQELMLLDFLRKRVPQNQESVNDRNDYLARIALLGKKEDTVTSDELGKIVVKTKPRCAF